MIVEEAVKILHGRKKSQRGFLFRGMKHALATHIMRSSLAPKINLSSFIIEIWVHKTRESKRTKLN